LQTKIKSKNEFAAVGDIQTAPELVGIRRRWTIVPKAAKIAGRVAPILYLLGLLGLFIAPHAKVAKRTYIDENALLPGQASTHYNGNDAMLADEIAAGFILSHGAEYVPLK
jgi:hypothetical protein